ncbi:YcbK family protein [Aquamicrobium sp. LC103]|uniref:YcbK family protein n=1 Tax=Aquamicrobium sp. LC103 TaxID=1120658 RepID=UPI0009E646F4|nr:YcbK family protein [Aquamicrobium sp. LC103]TKT76790.1 DUF882 domain-containing protein [Aquamicrobium sp. LC103]
MRAERARCKSVGKSAVLIALASVLLSSCSATSDSDTVFGLAAVNTSSVGAASDFNGTASNPGAMVMDEDDPSLPDSVAAYPGIRPGSETALAAVQPQAPRAEAQTSTANANPAPVQQQAAQAEQPAQAAADGTKPQQQGSSGQNAQAAATQFIENSPPKQFIENSPPQQQAATQEAEPKKRGFLSAFFSPARAAAAPTPIKKEPASQQAKAETAETKPLVKLASTRPVIASASSSRPIVDTGEALPGVRADALFEITRKSGLDDDSDVDLHEDEGSYQVASAAGLARLAPNGLLKQTESVDVACLKPSLVRVLKAVEGHYGRKVVITSGYRDPDRNRRARGARNSLHMYCAAADVQVPGVGKWELAEFVRTMPGRGGVGTYCHTESVHIDVGPERDWNWRCRRRK